MVKKLWTRIALSTALAGGMLLAVGAPVRATPDVRDDCAKRLESDRARIDRDAHRYGEHSKQVDRDVNRMDATRQWCRDHKADWDHSRFDVGIYFRG
jgi:hypothetical protein